MAKRKKQTGKSFWPVLLAFAGLAVFVAVIALLTRGQDIALLNPKGLIADEQSRLLVLSTSIMLAFAAVVIFFIYFFAWKYRETDENSMHQPDPKSGRSKLLIATAWLAPISIFVLLVSIMLPATQQLEPQRSIESDNNEITIRVIATRWKWIFLYPEQDIATVNYVQIPVDTPIRFELTADEAPMNSFWIPHLGGMLYAMTEHVNPLNLIAHTPGDYEGGAAEVNGHGFAGMRFTTRVSTWQDFSIWTEATAQHSDVLDAETYDELIKPTENVPPKTYYSPTNKEIFDNLLKKYSGSHNHYQNTEAMEGGNH